jgi:hypothetical protein
LRAGGFDLVFACRGIGFDVFQQGRGYRLRLHGENLIAGHMFGQLGEEFTRPLSALGIGHRLAVARIGGDLISKARERHDAMYLGIRVGLPG